MKYDEGDGKKGRKKRGIAVDEDVVPVRQEVRKIVEGKYVTIIMTLTTFFALFGDQIRLWVTNKESDPYFFAALTIALFLFSFELLIMSCVRNDDFKYGLFFWFDFIATASLLQDIAWIWDWFYRAFNSDPTNVDVNPGQIQDISGTESQTKQIMKSFRLIRLIRIIKLYNYAVKSSSEAEEAKLREQQKMSNNKEQAKLTRELEPSRLGNDLSEKLTRILTVGILLLLMFIPVFTYQGANYAARSGLRELFNVGVSNCKTSIQDKNILSYCQNRNLVTKEGWHQKLRQFVQSNSKSDKGDNMKMDLLWLFIPDWEQDGMMATIKSIPKPRNPAMMSLKEKSSSNSVSDDEEPFWQQTDSCAGFRTSPECPFRDQEMQLVTFQPHECQKSYQGERKIPNCDQLYAYARFNVKSTSQSKAFSEFGITIFTCLIMSVGSVIMTDDVDTIIILPVTKLVGIIKLLADDPLQKPTEPTFTQDELDDKAKDTIKTVQLQKTIYNIGRLLQMCFGHLGALIIKENLNSGDGLLEIMVPGRRHNVIFCVVRFQNYVQVTEILQEESIQFLNHIVHILHKCAFKWDGWANKSEGERFVLTWMLPDIDDSENEKNEQLLEERTEIADKSLIAIVKIICEVRRSQDLPQYYNRLDFVSKFGRGSKPSLNFALHQGYTIEGAIGSEVKTDASYMSPHLQAAYRLEKMCSHYEQNVIISETLYNILSLKARNTLRKIDVISIQTLKDPNTMGIYTYDYSFSNQEQIIIPDDHELGALIKLAEYDTINIESVKNRGVDYMFTLDSDLVNLQLHIQEFIPSFRQVFKCYITGDWDSALTNIDRCLELWDSDGPTKAIKYYMQFFKFQVPTSWAGSWAIDDLYKLGQAVQEDDLNEEISPNDTNIGGAQRDSHSGLKGNTSGQSMKSKGKKKNQDN